MKFSVTHLYLTNIPLDTLYIMKHNTKVSQFCVVLQIFFLGQDLKYWNVNYHVKCLSENCWFLFHCFFSVIWIISQINVFKTKCTLKCQNDFLGNYFWNLETPVFIFYVFITEIYLTNIWRDNWRFSIWHRKRTLLSAMFLFILIS